MIPALLILAIILLVSFSVKGQTSMYNNTSELSTSSGKNVPIAITNGVLNSGTSFLYAFNDTSTAIVDGINVIEMTGRSIGRWIRIKTSSATVQGLADSIAALRTYTQSIGKTLLYNKAGLVSAISKRFTDTFSVATATPTISLAAYLTVMGCTNFSLVSATGFRSGGTASNSPQVSVSAIASNSVSLVMSQQNTATVQILGISVLSGLPLLLVPDPTNTKIILSFDAW